jgi:hypothetical protein
MAHNIKAINKVQYWLIFPAFFEGFLRFSEKFKKTKYGFDIVYKKVVNIRFVFFLIQHKKTTSIPRSTSHNGVGLEMNDISFANSYRYQKSSNTRTSVHLHSRR